MIYYPLTLECTIKLWLFFLIRFPVWLYWFQLDGCLDVYFFLRITWVRGKDTSVVSYVIVVIQAKPSIGMCENQAWIFFYLEQRMLLLVPFNN